MQALQEAMHLHQQGHLDQAATGYRKIIEARPNHFDAIHLLGVLRSQQGRHSDAHDLIRKALTFDPNASAAWFNLGRVLSRLGRHDKALEAFDRALAIQPDNAEVLNNRGNALFILKRPDQALESYNKAIAIRPDYADALNNCGNTLFFLKRLEQALARFDEVVGLRPDYFDAFNSRGNVLRSLLRLPEALESYDKALAIRPDYAEALNNRGNVLGSLNRPQEALECFERALAVRPGFADALYSLGSALFDLHRPKEALESFDKALAIRPDFAAALNNRGNALRSVNRAQEAVASFDKALAIQPDLADALNNRGCALKDLRRLDEALASFDAALGIRPDFADALYNRGTVLKDLLRPEDALASFDKALAVQPDHSHAFSEVACSASLACNWQRYESIVAGIREHIDRKTSIIAPFVALGFCADPALLRKCSETFVQSRMGAGSQSPRRRERAQGDKIRIAYLSSDLREHAVAYLMAEVFELHDRNRFEIIAASYGPNDGSPMRLRLEKAFDEFHDVQTRDDADVAELLCDRDVDIAVDLNGHTADSRLGILARRPAPIQVNFLGFPGTSGAPFIDYIIADDFLIPESARQQYSEKIVYLPDCFQPNDRKRLIAERTPSRGECNLPDGGFVFCSFNNSYKLNPGVFDVWMRLLKAVPESVLWLVANNKPAVDNLRREAAARGVSPERLVFADRAEPAEYLARMRLADLFLDTWPFNAGTTASDAAWAGLPVVTLSGQAFAGRMAGSILKSVGLTELVTHALPDYEALATRLATHPAELGEIRRRLAMNRDTHPLFDAPRFTRHLEAAFAEMRSIGQRGEAPRSIRIEASRIEASGPSR